MKFGMRPARRHAAFTLIEILIVGALIALFAGLAIIGIQAQFENNIRKATIGETRQIAMALDFAFNDVGFFPKLCFLDDSIQNLERESQDQYGNPKTVYSYLHAVGINTLPRINTVESMWSGPYFSPAQYRTPASQGRGGARYVQFTEPGSGNAQFKWPLDPYNNPYAVYMLNINRSGGAYLEFVEPDKPTQTGNFVNAVVSYGKNNVPGGGPYYTPTDNPTNTSDSGPYGLRLYSGVPGPGGDPYIWYSRAEMTPRRASAWALEFAQNAGATGSLAQADNDPASPRVGITDVGDGTTPGSDDVVFTF